jgi:diacylglycerol kinase family enzyme
MKSKPDEISLIVNQDSGRVPAKMRSLSKISKQKNLKLKLCDGADLDSTIREALKNKKLKRIIIGGGDGTVTKAASLVRRLRPKVELAVLPLGTANYYAKSLKVDKNIQRAFEVALTGKPEKRFICSANKKDFLIGVNVGSTSQMFSEVTDEDKKRYGRFAYFKGLFKVIFRFSSPDLEVKTNGKKYKFVSTELVVLNHQLEEPVKITPQVSGTEPFFEIITYGLGNSKLSPLFAVFIFIITFGNNQKYLTRIKATKAKITSNKQHPFAVDGDSMGRLPLEIRIHKKPVLFIKG